MGDYMYFRKINESKSKFKAYGSPLELTEIVTRAMFDNDIIKAIVLTASSTYNEIMGDG